MKRSVYIADYSVLSALGCTAAQTAEALWAGELRYEWRSTGEREFPYFSMLLSETLSEALPKEIAWVARAKKAFSALISPLQNLPQEIPLFIASSSFQIGLFEQMQTPELPRTSAAFSQEVAAWLGLSGPCVTLSNACISGFSALEIAASQIANGTIDEALVIGMELSNRSTLAGFAAMDLLAQQICRPFDRDRDGLVLGEALAAIRLSASPGPWRIAAVRCGLDAWSLTSSDPTGKPMAALFNTCLQEAGMSPADIELVKLQAAGSPGSDLTEANALREVFNTEAPVLLSLKSMMGHTLGASGIAELAALMVSLDVDQVPATAGFSNIDPEISYSPLITGRRMAIRHALLNLIGFGGGIASLVLART